ncbi:MAG: type I methionyl aminopeptidase [Deltaproteobacteria bacterium]|nr:type I methionyl aminopeptidase [Deltaproteobacteria bacterium]
MHVKDPWELGLMRQSGRRLAEVAARLREAVRPEVTTNELDEIAARAIAELGALSSFKGYRPGNMGTPFPKTVCISVNEQVVHGIPGDRKLQSGDIVSVDLGLVYGGYHADCAFTVALGEVPARVRELLDVTEQSLYEGVARAVSGNRVGDVGHAIEEHVKPHHFGVIRDYVGHGIGRAMHELPSVPNFGRPRQGQPLKEGLCLAIEPMITLGGYKTKVLKDGWTVVTADGSLAAHFEHTIAITPKGPEILTVLAA